MPQAAPSNRQAACGPQRIADGARPPRAAGDAGRCRWTEIRDGIGFAALLVFAFFAWLGTGVAHGALAVMVLLMAVDYRAASAAFRHDPIARIFLLFVAYLLIGAGWAAHRWPETEQAQWSSVWPWVSLWLMFPIAWWLKGRWDRTVLVMALAPLGLIAGIVRRSQWADLPRWLQGERYEFGYTSLGISLLSLVILIGLLSFLPRFFACAQRAASRAGVAFGIAALLLFFLFVLLIAQSRGAWLSLASALLLVSGLAVSRRRTGASRPPGLMAALLVAGVMALGAVWQFGGRLAERIRSEADVVPQILTLDETRLPYTPWGARIHLGLWGARLVSKHPWFGYGPGANAPRHLLKREFDADPSGFLAVIEHFAHLHNAYLEILVRFGLIGGLLFGGGLFYFRQAMIENRKRGIIPPDFHDFGRVVLFTVLFFGLFEFRLLHTDFRFLSMLFGGILYTHALHRRAHEH